MSHFSHKSIMDSWNLYEQQTLSVLKKQKNTFECFEALSCLLALGLTLSAFFSETPTHKATLFTSSSLIAGLTAYADIEMQKKLQNQKNMMH